MIHQISASGAPDRSVGVWADGDIALAGLVATVRKCTSTPPLTGPAVVDATVLVVAADPAGSRAADAVEHWARPAGTPVIWLHHPAATGPPRFGTGGDLVVAVLDRDDADGPAFEECLRQVLEKGSWQNAPDTALDEENAPPEGYGDPRGLSPRELDVLRRVARGEDTLTIARDLFYSERTVKNIVHSVVRQLRVRNRAHAVALAARAGVL